MIYLHLPIFTYIFMTVIQESSRRVKYLHPNVFDYHFTIQ